MDESLEPQDNEEIMSRAFTPDHRSLAATIFQLFVASDTASDTLQSLKRLHGLMPYFVLKGILKISNPMAMIRGKCLRLFRLCWPT
jgi:hypothetical protein